MIACFINIQALALPVTDTFTHLKAKVQACTARNDKVIFSRRKNCLSLAHNLIDNVNLPPKVHLKLAVFVQESFGDTASLKFYNYNLVKSNSTDSCGTQGLRKALLSGLKLPSSFQSEILIAQEIAFKHCWTILEKDILEKVKSLEEGNDVLKRNICTGLKGEDLDTPVCI
jgi:hypothetical protein